MPASEELRGRLFDIQRFSVHDGRGIRTAVFFKGCPLRCSWCQNPEGLRREPELVWMAGRCIRCGECVKRSAAGGVFWEGEGLAADAEAPEDWQEILAACPGGALRWSSRDMTVSEVMDVIRRDIPFYRHGGGGVTLSGGDPVMQPDFAAALLRQCRREGVSTAMETEAALPWEQLEPLLEWLDEICVDLKLMDEGAAKRYTGCGSNLILDNISRLLSGPHKGKVTVRTPLIPGITAAEENLRRASAFLAALGPEIPWELLRYNVLAPAKYALLRQTYPLPQDLAAQTDEEMERLSAAAKSGGMRNVLWM